MLLQPVYKIILEKDVSLMLPQFTSYHNPKCKNSSRNLDFIWYRNAEPVTINFFEHSFSITEIKNTSSKLQMGSQGTIRKCEADFQINQLSKNKLSDHKFKILLI